MKRIAAAAVLAAAIVVPATQAGAQPILSEAACGVGMINGQGDKDCRFTTTANTLGFAGAVSGGYTLSHKETVASCVNNVTVITTVTKVDETGGAGPIAKPQYDFVDGITYTLEMTGNGGILAGGPSGGTPSPTAGEPAEKPLDKTGGAVAGAVCA